MTTMRSSAQQAVLVQRDSVNEQQDREDGRKYSIVRLETQDIDTDEFQFFHTVLIKSADKPARRAGRRK